ncbi:MAG: response regulator [Chthoniobacteraceae bacterium]
MISPGESNHATMRALILDDSKLMRDVLCAYLHDFGFETVQAEDGAEALLQLDGNGHFDLVTVDWNMPRMSGLEFVEAVRRRTQLDTTKLLMLTARSNMHDVSLALRSGANQYIMKPATYETIQDRLALMGLVPDQSDDLELIDHWIILGE